MFLMEMVIVSGYSYYPSLAFLKVSSNQDPTSKTSPSLHLSSKSLPGVLEDMDVLDGAGDGVRVIIISIKVFLKVSSRSKIRKLIKTPPILQVPSWSLGGHG